MTGGPELLGQIVVVIGGSSGIGLATARHARAEGAEVIITARDPERLKRAGDEVGARSTSAFDATDTPRLEAFVDALPVPIDHLMLTGRGTYYARLADMESTRHGALSTRSFGCRSRSPASLRRKCDPVGRCSSWPARMAAGRPLAFR